MTNTYNNRLRVGMDLQQPTGVWTNQFIYEAAGRLTNVTSPAGAFGYWLASGVPSTLTLRLDLPNTSYITNAYDVNARLLNTTLKNSSHSTLNSHQYSYDPANQRTQQLFSAGSTYNYTYDKIGQLKVADSGTASEDRGYTYDAAWNLNYRTNNGTLNTSSVDEKNQLTNATGVGVLGYDANGNMTSPSAETSYAFDDENRLIQIVTQLPGPGFGEGPDPAPGPAWRVDFTYDGLGRLRRQSGFLSREDSPGEWVWDVTNQVTYVYDGRRVVQERDGNTPTVSYTRGTDLSGTLEGAGGIGGLLARSHGYSSGNWSTHNFYHADGNGNITYLVDSSQALAASYRYDPYGNTISSSGTLANTNMYRFSSKELHVNADIYYYGYRWYKPSLQRWVNRDPIGERGGINLYGYVGNDSLDRADPLGLAYGNPVSGPSGPTGPSGPYGSGGGYYPNGYLYPTYTPPPLPPLFNSSFSLGLTASVNAEAGFLYGAGGNYSFGFGLFYNPNDGFSLGGFQGGGAFIGGPQVGRLPGSMNVPCSPTGKPSGVMGANAGWGVGPWISNAGSPAALGGPFDQLNFNSPLSGSYAYSGGTWIGSATIGYGGVASFSTYPTTTWSAGGFNLMTGQPVIYNP